MISSGTLSFWDPLAHTDFFKPMHASFPAHFGWRMYCSNAVKHGSAKLCCTSTLISSEKNLSQEGTWAMEHLHWNFLGQGSSHLQSCKMAGKTCVYQPESKDTKGQSTCYASKFPSLLTRLAELLECDQLRLAARYKWCGRCNKITHTNTKTIQTFFKFDVYTSKYEVVVPCCTLQRKHEQEPTEPSILTVNFRVFFVPVTTPHGSIDVLIGSATGSTLENPPIDV